jgi:hypothetical protein
MRLSSKGLGKMSLPFDLVEARIEIGDDGHLWFSGRIKERSVRWEYRLRLDDTDIVRFMALARHPEIIRYVAAELGPALLRRIVGRAWSTAVGLVAPRRRLVRDRGDAETQDAVLVEGTR